MKSGKEVKDLKFAPVIVEEKTEEKKTTETKKEEIKVEAKVESAVKIDEKSTENK